MSPEAPSRPEPKAKKSAPDKQASILHMTLPGGALETERKKKSRFHRKDKDKSKPLTKWGKIRKWGLRSGLVVAALVLLIGGFLFTKGLLQAHKVFKGGG
jgi:hypothetical protein